MPRNHPSLHPSYSLSYRAPHTPAHPRRRLAVAAAALVLAAACGTSSPASSGSATCSSSTPGGMLTTACDTTGASGTLQGQGSTSVNPLFVRAFYDYNKANPALTVNYTSNGSGPGVTAIEQNTAAFGDSEIPIPAPATGTAGPILQIPVDLGGVAISYNLPGVANGLKLDGPTLAGIFLGTITSWNDQAIQALNSGVTLPALPIVPVHRSDTSGPGYDVDQYLIESAGSTWTSATASTKPSTAWPAVAAKVGVAGQGNAAVASAIQGKQGAIGYVEYAYALSAGFHSAALKTPSGTFVTPSTESIASAGGAAGNLSATHFNIVDGAGELTYPIANFSWTLLYQKQSSTQTGINLGKVFDWLTTTGQQDAQPLGYAPLPANAASLAHQTLLNLQTSDGKPLFALGG